MARAPRRPGAPLHASLRIKLAMAVVCLPAGLVALDRLGVPLVVALPLLAAHAALTGAEWLGSYLRGFGRILAESAILAAGCVAAFACGAAALLAGAGLPGFAVSQALAQAGALAGAAWFVRRTAPFPLLVPAGTETVAFARRALPTGLAILAGLGSWRLGLLALAAAGPGGPDDAGMYAAAHRLFEAARFLPAAAAAALFPAFARRSPRAGWRAVLLVAVPAAAVIAVLLGATPLARTGLLAAYGPAFAGAVPLLTPFLLAFPALSANAILAFWLIARGRERANLGLAVLHLAAHAVALAWFVPAHGALGAAWALAAAEGVLCLGALLILRRG